MQTKYFSPSVNIIRDKDSSVHYLPSRNSERAFHKIITSFEQGTRSFNIIGAYGSGKSAFILALDKVLNNKANYFSNPLLGKIDEVDSIFIIGEFASFKQAFVKTLKLDSDNIWDSLIEYVQSKNKEKTGQLWVVDEFGKFLEFAAKEDTEELYFIQQLAEFVNNQNFPILFITTLHQAFEDYALELSKTQRNEWEKVKGRLVEVSFNEPVEQLLFLASERLAQKSTPCKINLKAQKQLFDSIQNAEVFPMRDYFSFDFSKKIFPFDILSAALVTVAFQRYGQNERSLFTLLESQDYLGLNDFLEGCEYYNVANIYDYLKYNFHSLLNSRLNSDSANWKAIDDAIQRAESLFDNEYDDASKLLKTIGLTAILGRRGQKLTKDFLVSYARIALDIKDPLTIIEKLETKQIIRYRNYSQRFVLFKGTDIDINLELEFAESLVSKDFSIVNNLQKHFNFPIIPAKRVSYEKGTPRHFIFEISENPTQKTPEGQIDGYINIILNEFINEETIQEYSRKNEEAILFGLVHDASSIRDSLFEIEKIHVVKSKCINDSVALFELDAQLEASINKLNEHMLSSIYGQNSIIKWYHNGEIQQFENPKSLNAYLSTICEETYEGTPTFKNELINREKLSGTITSAKYKFVDQLISHVRNENLGFEENSFPPEKTIYLTLLRNTGVHQLRNDSWSLDQPVDESFQSLWDISNKFLDDCSIAPRKLLDFIDILKTKPLKLKQGFIEFWLPIFLITKKNNYAFYELDSFVPNITVDTLDVAMRQPHKYTISTFSLDNRKIGIFNRYRFFLNQIEEENPNSESFIETIKPFLIFYNRMVPYTKNTKSLSKEAHRLRDAISSATNPEKVFFEDIPRALGYTLNDFDSDQKMEEFSLTLHNATRELSGTFPSLVNRIEETISRTIRSEKIDFPENKLLLQKRFKKLKQEYIDPKLKVLIQRINTPLDDRQSWINSVATAIINKSIDQFTDEDEIAFNSIFPKRIHELDNLTDISHKDIDVAEEEILKVEFTSFVKGVQSNLYRFPKGKTKQFEKAKSLIRELLDSNDKQSNIALLIKLLQEEIDNE